MTRAANLRAEAEALRAKLHDEISPMTRHRVQTLIDELEAEARLFDNGDAGDESWQPIVDLMSWRPRHDRSTTATPATKLAANLRMPPGVLDHPASMGL